MKISIIYTQYLKQFSKCCRICPPFDEITEGSRFRNCVITWSVKFVRRRHVYLWHHEWRHKEYLTWTLLRRILIFYRLRILSLASTLWKNETVDVNHVQTTWRSTFFCTAFAKTAFLVHLLYNKQWMQLISCLRCTIFCFSRSCAFRRKKSRQFLIRFAVFAVWMAAAESRKWGGRIHSTNERRRKKRIS